MDIRSILQSAEGYAAQNRAIPPELKEKAQRLCWEYNRSAPDQKQERQSILVKTREGKSHEAARDLHLSAGAGA